MLRILMLSSLTIIFAQGAYAQIDGVAGPHTSVGVYTSDEDLAKLGPGTSPASAPTTVSGSPGASAKSSGVNINDVVAMGDECTKSREKAGRACNDPMSTDGMSRAASSTMAEKLMLIGQLGQLAASATGNSKICTLAAGLSSAAQVVSMIKGQACSGTQSSCSNTCDQAYDAAVTFDRNTQRQLEASGLDGQTVARLKRDQDQADEIRRASLKYRGACNGMAAQAGQAMMQAMMLAQSLQQTAQCAKDTASTNPYATPPPLSLVSSNVDCSNASFAATSMACICKSTPSDPMCGQFNNGGVGSGGGGGVVGGSVTTPGMSAEEATDGQVVDPAPEFKGKGGSYT
ncbi:MAG: hypothetical protein EOP06_06665, partial [Proteobacteria bacterium]